VATGGTIASKYLASSGQVVAGASVEELASTVPELLDIAELRTIQHSNVTSDVIDTPTIVELGRLLRKLLAQNETAGVVVTHGTATLEETAYFLDLTLNTEKSCGKGRGRSQEHSIQRHCSCASRVIRPRRARLFQRRVALGTRRHKGTCKSC
jgi:hypothetical protein